MKEKIINMILELNDDFQKDWQQDLIEEGILDSLDIMKLITMVEDEFEIEIPIEFFNPEYFCSVCTIMKLLNKLGIEEAK